MEKKYNKVVLTYSGGLDTSVLITWLKEHYGCEVIAVSVSYTHLDVYKRQGIHTARGLHG